MSTENQTQTKMEDTLWLLDYLMEHMPSFPSLIAFSRRYNISKSIKDESRNTINTMLTILNLIQNMPLEDLEQLTETYGYDLDEESQNDYGDEIEDSDEDEEDPVVQGLVDKTSSQLRILNDLTAQLRKSLDEFRKLETAVQEASNSVQDDFAETLLKMQTQLQALGPQTQTNLYNQLIGNFVVDDAALEVITEEKQCVGGSVTCEGTPTLELGGASISSQPLQEFKTLEEWVENGKLDDDIFGREPISRETPSSLKAKEEEVKEEVNQEEPEKPKPRRGRPRKARNENQNTNTVTVV